MSNRIKWHLGHLDALRGIAVLSVITVHSSLGMQLSRWPTWISFSGQRGVQLFFLVSAFTLFMSRQNRKAEHHPTRNFFLRRFFRLAPMFYITTVATYFFLHEWVGPWRHILASVLFVNGFHPVANNHGAAGGWSVAVEAIFYMSLPVLYRYIRSLTAALLWFCTAAPVLFVVTHVFSHRYPQHAGYFEFFSFLVEFPIFLMGIVVYFVWKEMVVHNEIRPLQRKQLSFLLICIATIGYITILPFTYRTLYPSSGLFALLLMALSIHAWPLFVNRFTIYMGRISYSVYLLHFFVFIRLEQRMASSTYWPTHPLKGFAFLFAITLTLSALAASLTWRFVEEPGIHLGRRLIAHLEHRTLTRQQARLLPAANSAFQPSHTPDAQF